MTTSDAVNRSAPAQETPSTRPGMANPAPWAVTAFGTTSFMLGMYQTQLLNNAGISIVLPAAFFFGGLVQIIVAVMQFSRGDMFAGAVFGTYGPFWVMFGAFETLYATSVPTVQYNDAISLFLAVFAVITFYLSVASLQHDFVLSLILWLIFAGLVVLAVGSGLNNIDVTEGGGGIVLAFAILAWYRAAGDIIESTFGRKLLPFGPTPIQLLGGRRRERADCHSVKERGEKIMTSFDVAGLSALEILDSRGRPTLAVTVTLGDGTTARAGVPSGASTGSREAVELRDGDPARYGGRGVLQAAANVTGEIADLLRGRSWDSLAEADRAMIELDGTPGKGRLGANAIIGTSMALARALAAAAGQPLWRWLAPDGVTPSLPVPHFNVVNGGVHAANELDFQEFMIAPLGAPSMAEAVRAGAEVYAALRGELAGRNLSTGLGDEGGFAPELREPEDVLRLLVQAIGDAGYVAGRSGVSIALDLAASEFRQPDGRYRVAGGLLTSGQLTDRLAAIIDEFPVHLIEDGLGEDDDAGWTELTKRLGGQVELVGDDNFCTNPAIIASAVKRGIANASLIKLNQIGTVTETLEAMATCRRAGYRQFVSHRSGETEDSFIADLAVGTGCGHLKSGAPARGERTAKYNRLIEIAATTPELRYGLGETR